MTTLATTNSAVVCHCLQITESQVQESIDNGQIGTVKDVMDCTGAGTGCTACHRRIVAMLRQQCRQGSTQPAQT